jgi:hypothetical protein
MTAIFLVMRFDVASIAIWIFELPLDQQIRAAKVIGILLGFERGLVLVAIAEDRSRYVVGVKMHASLNYSAGLKKRIAIPADLKPRYRGSDTAHMRRTARGFLVAGRRSDAGS